MIISSDIKPDRDLYFLGSKVIEVLIDFDEKKVDYFELFQKINLELEISLNLYILVLDWLFIIGVIKNAENRLIEKCF
jgi:ABC-three component (ABC-3C) system Middle Component 6